MPRSHIASSLAFPVALLTYAGLAFGSSITAAPVLPPPDPEHELVVPSAATIAASCSDTTSPSVPTELQADPPPGIWANRNIVKVTWSAAEDSPCGIDGYGEFWTTAATACPGHTKDLEEFPTSTVRTLPDGVWYYSLSSVDNAGNWSVGCGRIGPLLIDTTPPGSVLNLRSLSHRIGVWTAPASITLAWTDPIDLGSGIEGYGIVVWAGYPIAPPLSITTRQLGTYVTAALSDGAGYYVTVRAVDAAGNWSPSYATVGPFSVDGTPPTPPMDFESPTHLIGGWSIDRTIVLTWRSSLDGASGVQGYSTVWSRNADDVPTGRVNETANVATSPTLTDGTWWFHVQALDEARNATSVVHVGPFFIGTSPVATPIPESASHVVGVCSNDCTVDLAWPEPPPGSSTVIGYSYLWSTSPLAEPGTTLSSTARGTSSPCLSPGSWYFHIRAVDDQARVSVSAHLGPFVIDTLPPGAPPSLAHSSSVPGTWSRERDVSIAWTPAVDEGCGVAGYSVEWSANPSTLPDGTVTTVGPSVVGSGLADGANWYAHVRTVDTAGNSSISAAHFGPFWIDGTAPSVRVVAPNGGESWTEGEQTEILVQASDETSGLARGIVELSLDSGLTWQQPSYDGSVLPDATLPFTVPQLDSDNARVRVTVFDVAGNSSSDISDGDFSIGAAAPPPLPMEFVLYQNVPNPFNPTTNIGFDLPRASNVTLTVFDAGGRRVALLARGEFPAGHHVVVWDGRDDSGRLVGSGTYLCRLHAGGFEQTRKMGLLH